jgi:hypothetical protein
VKRSSRISKKKTQLARFVEVHREKGVTPTALARETGYSRPHIYNVINGQEPTRECMDLMLVACSKLTGRRIDRHELFEFKPYRDKGRKAS